MLTHPPLRPLLNTIRPALLERAEEITIIANLADVTDNSGRWQKAEKTFALALDKDFYPFVAFSRLKILSRMSTLSEKTHNGSFRLRINRKLPSWCTSTFTTP